MSDMMTSKEQRDITFRNYGKIKAIEQSSKALPIDLEENDNPRLTLQLIRNPRLTLQVMWPNVVQLYEEKTKQKTKRKNSNVQKFWKEIKMFLGFKKRKIPPRISCLPKNRVLDFSKENHVSDSKRRSRFPH